MTSTQRYRLDVPPPKATAIHVAPALHPILAGTVDEWRAYGLHLVFMDDYETPAATLGAVVLVPAFTPSQAAALAKLVDSHPLSIVIGVVRDTTGLQTHTAIAAGASYVANLHLAWHLLLEELAPAILCSRRSATTAPSQTGITALDPVEPGTDTGDAHPGRGDSYPPANFPAPTSTSEYQRIRVLGDCDLDDLASDDVEVVRLLQHEDLSIREIANRLYLSQRSLYRRLRRIYTQLGVTNRRELADVVQQRSRVSDTPTTGDRAAQ